MTTIGGFKGHLGVIIPVDLVTTYMHHIIRLLLFIQGGVIKESRWIQKKGVDWEHLCISWAHL